MFAGPVTDKLVVVLLMAFILESPEPVKTRELKVTGEPLDDATATVLPFPLTVIIDVPATKVRLLDAAKETMFVLMFVKVILLAPK